jgi:rhodanese-related sulfurtransferase
MTDSLNVEKSLLQTLVPVNALTEDHLDTLLRDTSMEVIYPGQRIFSIGDNDGKSVYLLSGQVLIQDVQGDNQVLSADNPLCQFPLKNVQPRAEHITAANDCLIIRFDTESLDRMLTWDQASTYLMLDINAQRDMDEDADWLMTLLQSNLFYKVPPMNIRKIINEFEAVYFSAGETVIRQGEVGDSCYFIKEGVVSVYQAINERFVRQAVNELGVGKCFGEDSLVNNVPRNATIVMKTNGVLMKLNKISFYRLLKTPVVETVNFLELETAFTSPPLWIDVRTEDEYDSGHYEGAVNMPLNLLKLKSRLIEKGQPCVIYCNSGRRSEAAAYLLSEEGFSSLVLGGGISSCTYEQKTHFTVVDEQYFTGT